MERRNNFYPKRIKSVHYSLILYSLSTLAIACDQPEPYWVPQGEPDLRGSHIIIRELPEHPPLQNAYRELIIGRRIGGYCEYPPPVTIIYKPQVGMRVPRSYIYKEDPQNCLLLMIRGEVEYQTALVEVTPATGPLKEAQPIATTTRTR